MGRSYEEPLRPKEKIKTFLIRKPKTQDRDYYSRLPLVGCCRHLTDEAKYQYWVGQIRVSKWAAPEYRTHTQGVGKRKIARVLGISGVAVRKVLRSNSTALPELHRTEKAEPYRQQILELLDRCKGNLVRVHEDLVIVPADSSLMVPEILRVVPACRIVATGRNPIINIRTVVVVCIE